MAKSDAARSAEWRRRLLLKSSIFDDLNAERAARIRQAFPGDDRPEVRAVVEFFANYPRCQQAPADMFFDAGRWCVRLQDGDAFESAAAFAALSEIVSTTTYIENLAPAMTRAMVDQVRDEVAEMRALGLWGRS